MPVVRIVSGGQTGADRGGLDAALTLGLECGGWCPRGRRAEDGRIPDRYPLRETGSSDYAERTEANVMDSDGTVLVTRGPATGGSALTAQLARRHRKPLLAIDLDRTPVADAADALAAWIDREAIATLNVAGSRASKAPTLAADVLQLVRLALLRPVAGSGDGELAGQDIEATGEQAREPRGRLAGDGPAKE